MPHLKVQATVCFVRLKRIGLTKFPSRIINLILGLIYALASCSQPPPQAGSRLARMASDALMTEDEFLEEEGGVEETDDEGIAAQLEVDPEQVRLALTQSWDTYERPSKVSRFDLDDRKFLVTRFFVGFKDFLKSKTPYLIFERPKHADWVEIMRCKRDAAIGSGVDNFDIADVEIASGLTPIEKSRIFRNNDFWGEASSVPDCQVISLSHMGEDFLDPTADSGSYRYIVRPCVAESRLTDADQTTSRTCSRQIAVSQPLEHFTNTRKQMQKEALKEAELIKSEYDQQGMVWYNKVREYAAELKSCEEREHKRAVKNTKKRAIIGLAAAGAGIAYEIISIKRTGGWGGKGFSKWFGIGMDVAQMSGELGGMTFQGMFTDLATQSSDMPRACARAIRLDQDVSHETSKFQKIMERYYWAMSKAQTGEDLQSVSEGKAAENQEAEEEAEAAADDDY